MSNERVFKMSFSSIYPHYLNKAEKKGRGKEEVDEVICWLTGYTPPMLAAQIEEENDLRTFFSDAPSIHPNASKITGVICGIRVEEIEDPLMQKIRYMDKLVDEVARGKRMASIMRE